MKNIWGLYSLLLKRSREVSTFKVISSRQARTISSEFFVNAVRKSRFFRYPIIVSLIIILGFALRFANIEQSPPFLYWDEASIGYEAYSIAQTGKDMHGNHWLQAIFPAYGDYKAPVYIWLTALAVKVLGLSITSIRLTSVLAGTATIAVTYGVVNQLTQNKRIALFSSLCLAILPWHLQFSRAGFEANLGVFLFSLAILLQLLGRKRGVWLIPSAMMGLLSIYSYFSMRVVIPIVSLAILVMYWKAYRKWILWLILGIAVYLLGALPLVNSPYFEAANQYRLSTTSILNESDSIEYSNQVRQQDNFSFWGRLIHHRYVYIAKAFFTNIADHFSFDYLFLYGDPNIRHSTQVAGIMLPIMLPLLLAGLYFGFKYHRKVWLLLLIWFGASLIPASIPQETPHALRSLTGVVSLVALLGIGAEYLYQKLRLSQVGTLVIGGYVVLLIVNLATFVQYYQVHYPKASYDDWQAGYKPVVEYIIEQQDNYDQIIVDDIDRMYLYYLLLSKYPPDQVQAQSQLQRQTQPNNFEIKQMGNVSFGDLDNARYDLDRLPILQITKSNNLTHNSMIVNLLKVNNDFTLNAIKVQ